MASVDKLGTLEFSAVLNGDDISQVISFLIRFIKTVKKERKLAFMDEETVPHSLNDDNNVILITSSDENDDIPDTIQHQEISLPSPVKKRRLEEWKLDTKSYNVPFVGTSTSKGSYGIIEKNSWPTGFLFAYLKQSPRAMELLGEEKKKKCPFVPPEGSFHKTLLRRNLKSERLQSIKLHNLFLQSLGELVTCAIPLYILNEQKRMENLYRKSRKNYSLKDRETISLVQDSPVQLCYQQIISSVMKFHFSDLLQILNSETISGAEQRHSSMVLTALSHLACTSVGTAREVARGLGSNLREGVLSTLMHSSDRKIHRSKDSSKSSEASNDEKGKEGVMRVFAQKEILRIRSSFLHLASSLLELDDSVVTSYVTTSGSKENKTKPGIVYIAVRKALSHESILNKTIDIFAGFEHEVLEYHWAVYRLVRTLRLKLIIPSNRPLSDRALIDLLKGEALNLLSRISLLASKSSNNKGYGSDIEAGLNLIAFESRRIVHFILLEDRSPFLVPLHSDDSLETVVDTCIHQLNHCVRMLTSTTVDIPTQNFITQCFANSPILLSHFFRTMAVPEPKPSFSCIASFQWIVQLIQKGPLIQQSYDDERIGRKENYKTEKLISHIMPTKLTKNILSKALQSTNSLLVCESLKLIISILERCRLILETIPSHSQNVVWNEIISDTLQKRLPDVQVLLSVRSKYDPFSNKEASQQPPSMLINSILTGFVSNVMQLYTSMFSVALLSVQFDWLKLLPEKHEAFFSVNRGLQHKVLKTFEAMYEFYSDKPLGLNTIATPKALLILIKLMLNSECRTIYQLIRELAIKVLSVIVRTEEEEIDFCLEYEITLWLDGISEENISVFYSLLDVSQKFTVQYAIMMSHAWQAHFPTNEMPGKTISSLLSFSLVGITSKPFSYTQDFISFVCKIAMKMLLFQFNTSLPLAALICHIFTQSRNSLDGIRNRSNEWKGTEDLLNGLHQYAKTIIDGKDNVLSAASEVTSTCFGENHFHSMLLSLSRGKVENHCDLMINSNESSISMHFLRQCIQFSSSESNHKTNEAIVITNLLATVTQEKKYIPSLENILGQVLDGSSYSITRVTWLLLLVSSFADNPHVELSSSIQKIFSCLETLLESNLLFNPIEGRKAVIPLIFPACLLRYLPNLNLNYIIKALQKESLIGSIGISVIFRTLLLKCLSPKTVLPHICSTQSLFPIEDAFKLWMNLSEGDFGTSRRSILDLRNRLEKLMATILASSEKYGLVAVALYSCICDSDPKTVVELALDQIDIDRTDKSKPSGPRHSCEWTGHSFLSSLLIYDMSMFGRPLMPHLVEKTRRSDCWDDVLSIFVHQSKRQQYRFHITGTTSSINIADITCQRAISLMNNDLYYLSSCSEERSFKIIFSALPSVLDAVESGRFQELWTQAASFAKQLREKLKNHVPIGQDFLQFVQLMVSKNQSTPLMEDSQFQTLCASALVYAISVLPKFLNKKMYKEKSSSCKEVVFTIFHLLIVPNIIKELTYYNDVSSSPLKDLVARCLQYGLKNCAEGLSSVCIKIVHRLLEVVFASKGVDSVFKKMFLPHHVHVMILSHSSFDSFMLSGDRNDRCDLILLLICCISLDDGKEKEIEKDIFLTLSKAHNAGFSTLDCLIRRLLYLYETNEQFVFQRLRLCDIRWGNLPEIPWVAGQNLPGTDHGQHYEWFIQGLDIRRIRQTLAKFPLFDMIQYPSDSSAKYYDVSNGRKMNQDVTPANQPRKQAYRQASSMQQSLSNFTANVEKPCSMSSVSISDGTPRRDWDDDENYSVAFLMPIVLSVLESFAQKAESMDVINSTDELNETMDNSHPPFDETDAPTEANKTIINPWRESFVKITYRLSQKGVFSLAFACLSSKCPELRQIAVAVLFFFLKALHTKEAEHIATWRERPQLAMIIDSVQKGLVIRRAMKFSKEQKPESEYPSLYVPMLPAVDSLFLARSVLILTKPANEMYPSINKFFLRLQKLGAHTECFSLPAFMSLFCSADESGRARKEREWAINLLKEGTLDEFSYKVIARRHAPELLLTSFENLVRRSNNGIVECECLLLLDTIQNLLECGGILSFHHLICTVGIFSWIQCLAVRLTTPTVKYRILKLLHLALDRTIKNRTQSVSEIIFETTKLAKVVIQIFVDTVDCKGPMETSAVCDVLWLLRQLGIVQSTNRREDLSLGIDNSGIQLGKSVLLLKTVKEESISLYKSVGALCYLPIAVKKENREIAAQFCKIALECILNDPDHLIENSICVHVMNRISLFVTFFNIHDNIGLIEMILGGRRKAISCESVDSWLHCVSCLLNQNKAHTNGENSMCSEVGLLKILTSKLRR